MKHQHQALSPRHDAAPWRFRILSLPDPRTTGRISSMKIKVLVLSTFVLFLFSAGAIAQTGGEWPQWRGANRDGISKETGLLKQWPEGGPPLVWKATGAGGGYSSFAISKGRLYTMG